MRCANVFTSKFQDSGHRFINMHCTDIVRDRMGRFFCILECRYVNTQFLYATETKQQKTNKQQTLSTQMKQKHGTRKKNYSLQINIF